MIYMSEESKALKPKKNSAPKKENEKELEELDREAKAVEESEEEGKEEFGRENP